MTQREWKRRRDTQRLLNMHRTAMAAEVDAAPIPPDRQIQEARIISYDEAAELSPEFFANFADEMHRQHARNLTPPLSSMVDGGMFQMGVDPAGAVEGRQVTALEIRDRQPRRGFYFGPQNENSAPPMNQRSRVTAPVYFNRWMDMVDSENELQSFLWLCYRVAETDRREGAMTVKDLEGDE